MKNMASGFLKQVVSVLVSVVKAKAMAVKSKTNNAMKTRLIIFRLLRNKKVLMSAIYHKIHALMMGHDKDREGSGGGRGGGEEDDNSKAIVLYNAPPDYLYPTCTAKEDNDNDYPDLRHSLFEHEDDWIVNGTGSVIDLVRDSKEDGSEFSLEDEIDRVADMFIRRFHTQMKMQKLESFKRYKEMLDRSV